MSYVHGPCGKVWVDAPPAVPVPLPVAKAPPVIAIVPEPVVVPVPVVVPEQAMPALLSDLAGYVRIPFPVINAASPTEPLYAAVRELVGDPRATLYGVLVARGDFDVVLEAATEFCVEHEGTPEGEDAQVAVESFEEHHVFEVRDDVAPGHLYIPQQLIDRAKEAKAYTLKAVEARAVVVSDVQAAPAPSSTKNPTTATVAWVEELQSYVARARDGVSWNISNPLTEKAAIGALVNAGVSLGDAKAATGAFDVPYAKFIDCEPGREPLFQSPDGAVLNNYVPSLIIPSASSWRTIITVLDFLTRGDAAARAWLTNWMANAYVNPGKAMRTVPVLYGAQKTGKSLLARVMTALIGEANSASIRNDDIKNRFNAHFVGKLLVTVGEIDASEHEKANSTLKWLTGEPRLMAEAKGITPFEVKNRVKLIVTSNQTLPVKLEPEDTRWCLFRQLDKPAPEYLASCEKLFTRDSNEWTDAGRGELAGFAQHLRHEWKLDASLASTVFSNSLRESAIASNQNSVQLFVGAVNEGSMDEVFVRFVPEHERSSGLYSDLDVRRTVNEKHGEARVLLTGKNALFAIYRAFCKGSGLQPLGAIRFPAELERFAPEWEEFSQRAGARPRLRNVDRSWVDPCYTAVKRDIRVRDPQRITPAHAEPGVEGPTDHPNIANAVEQFGLALVQS